MFHPLVEAWFRERHGAPTDAQERAWASIASGHDTLVCSPTGSGKTLAAFLFCLDRLVRRGWGGPTPGAFASGEPAGTDVVYVSPLRALSADVHRNLLEPLEELADKARGAGLEPPSVRVGLRTGDTPASERRQAVKNPPDVLVTTPESLFILLGSESGRSALSTASTIIVDEIHALAGDKRGAHLSLSLERLEELVVGSGRRAPQRIGLSATIRPVETAGRLLVGRRDAPVLVEASRTREPELAVEVPRDELGAVCTNEQWEEVYDRIADLSRGVRSTLVFVDMRKLAERVALHLAARLGAESVAPHHGSLARARRQSTERRLKSGELRVVVATASLELGIDVGAVDLVCSIGAPRSVSTALQRIGRSGHVVGATSRGRFFPLTRDQLLACAAVVRAVRRGTVDAVTPREAPLDVLAQQIVAECACGERGEDELYALMRRAAPYAELSREDFDAVVEMLAEGFSARRGRAGALLHRDAVAGKLRGRRGARIAALTCGGAIPDAASYDVVLLGDGTRVGTLDEDFAVESSAGDVFLLGSTSWRIHRVETGNVFVEDARGAPPTVPFWLGEAPARTLELSEELSRLREELALRLDAPSAGRVEARAVAVRWLVAEAGLDARGAELACDYVDAGRAALGAMPSRTTLVAERFFDEAGGTQLVLHAPFGARINRALGFALRKRFCRSFDFELQAAATDDGVLLSLGAQQGFPLGAIFGMLRPESLDAVLAQAALQSPLFATRFRHVAARALALLRFSGGRRVPPALLRMRAEDLLTAIFPGAVGCQDNHPGGPIEIPDHPLVREAMRDCLTEAMDVEGLKALLLRIQRGEVTCVARETPEPSVLSHEILNANPYAFLDDAPLEERRARAVSLRRGLPAEIAERLGALDPGAVDDVVSQARPPVRDADELHDVLLDRIALPEGEALAAGYGAWLAELAAAGRAGRVDAPTRPWVAAERRAHAALLWPGRPLCPEPASVAQASAARVPVDAADALAALVRGRMTSSAPIAADRIASEAGLPESEVLAALLRLESEGLVMRGSFGDASGTGAVEWCDRVLLARVHGRTVEGLRRALEPVTVAELFRFLLVWQGARPAARGGGRKGLLRAIGQLQGLEIAAGAWESEILPARVRRYDPAWLDELCLSGEVVWGRILPRAGGSTPTRAAPVTLALRRDLPWLLALAGAAVGEREDALSGAARGALAFLEREGASFFEDIAQGLGASARDAEDALWELVAAGRVTGDGFAGLRALLARAGQEKSGARRGAFRPARAPVVAGRWSLLRRPGGVDATSAEAATEAFARQLLARYGIVLRDLAVRDPVAPPWRDLLRVFRRLELRGEVRGGRLVAGFVGEQFALPDALSTLRAVRNEPPSAETVRLSACDPLHLAGVLTSAPRVPARLSRTVRYRDGVLVEGSSAMGARVLRSRAS